MFRTSLLGTSLAAFVCALLLSTAATAQQAAIGIAGVIKDTSGAVLPGVTVEAASPALIEKVRTVVTDDEGRYNIVNLRPGTYTVTFTLTGFSTSKRERIVLTAGFTATVNADLQVGALEETVTVTGESPLVDTQNARQQKVFSDEVLTMLPTGQASVVNLIALTPGMTGNATVGGSTGAYHSQQMKGTFHGKRGSHILYDGMRIDNYAGAGDSPGYLFNVQTVEETAVETGGVGADSDSPNVAINMVPKEGGNTFRYGITGLFTDHNFQSDNYTEELGARDLQPNGLPNVDRMYDFGVTMGGPIKKDSIWFFAAFRRWGTRNQAANLFWNKTQGTPFFTPDLSRPAHRDEKYQSHAARITWQATQKNKLNFFVDIKKDCVCQSGGAGSALGSGANNAQEGENWWSLWPNGIVQGTWNMPVTNRLLLEAGADMVLFHWPGLLAEGVSPNDVAIVEQTGVPGGAPGNFRYNSGGGIYHPKRRIGDRYSQRVAISYVTGSHNFKTGFQIDEGYSDQIIEPTGLSVAPGISYIFNRGIPVSVRYDAVPRHETYYQRAEMGIYSQDQWSIKRMTVNYGLRFDYYNGYIPAVHRPAGPFVPEVSFPATKGAPAWKDLDPRMGVAFDLFGNGRTALKASFGRYVAMTGNGQVSQYHPLNTSINSTTRAWTDTNRNYFPDCDLHNFAPNGECEGLVNTNFGKTDPNARRFADDVRYGWGARPNTWDSALELQHQVGAGISLTAGYYHNWNGSFTVTDNVDVSPADFSPFCVTAAKDARLPGGGGYQIRGLYDVNLDKFGQVHEVVTQSSNFGKQKRINDFVGVNVETRFGRGIRFGGGVDTGRTLDDVCFNVDAPGPTASNLVAVNLPGASTSPRPHTATTVDGKRTCRVVTPLAGNTQIKFNGSYPLPWDLMLSGTFQNLPGISYFATYNATTAEIAPSLGRPLSGGTRTAAVPLLIPQTLREPRRTQVDLRLTKTITLSNRRVQANFDVYNVFNTSPVLGENNAFGSTWRQPTLILNGRLIQFSGRVDF